MQRVDFQDLLVKDPKRARQVWVREFQGNNTGGSCFVYVCRPTGSEHAREMSHQMQGDAVVDWLLEHGATVLLSPFVSWGRDTGLAAQTGHLKAAGRRVLFMDF